MEPITITLFRNVLGNFKNLGLGIAGSMCYSKFRVFYMIDEKISNVRDRAARQTGHTGGYL